MHSADHTASSRYSSSPHSATHDAPPPTAGGGYPSINPAVFNSSYSMSRSTSGASDTVEYNTRLLTPHADYRPLGPPPTAYSHHMSHDLEMRKMSDSLGRMPSNRFMPQSFAFDPSAHLGPHPQPDVGGGGARGWSNEFALSAERGGDNKMGIHVANDTDYERQRQEQIVHNKKLMEDMGLGNVGGAFGRSRSVTHHGSGDRSRHSVTPVKKRVASEAPGESHSDLSFASAILMSLSVRSSPRIASLHRTSYTNLDGGDIDEGSDEYISEGEQELEDEEDDFRPAKRAKGGRGGYTGRKGSYAMKKVCIPPRHFHRLHPVDSFKSNRAVDLSLYGLLQVYPEIPHSYPLFYYTLNNDLTINPDSVPLIGSIPSNVTAVEKANTLRDYFHRGRRVLAQLDAFTSRCDRKYDGAQEKLIELEFNTRIAIRDVRRKVVERCENYKYTRRDILDK